MRTRTWIYASTVGGLVLLPALCFHLVQFEAGQFEAGNLTAPDSDEASVTLEVGRPPADPALMALLGQARVQFTVDRFGDALQSYEKLRQSARGHPQVMVEALRNQGLLAKQRGDFHQALSLYHQALEIARQADEREDIGRTLHDIGVCYTSLGEYQLAMDAFEEALDARRSPWQRAATLTAIATLHDLEGDHETAIALLRQALALRRGGTTPAPELWRRGMAATLDRLATAAMNSGRLHVARRAYESSRLLLHDSRYGVHSAVADLNLSRLLVELGDTDTALPLLTRAEALLAEKKHRQAQAAALLTMARAYQLRDASGTARQNLEQAIEIVEALRETVFNPYLRSTFLASHRVIYESAVHIAMLQHKAEPEAGHHLWALELAERAKARSLLDLLLEGPRGKRRAQDLDIEQRMRPLEDELNRLEHKRLSLLQRRAPVAAVAAIEKAQRAVILKNEETWNDLQTRGGASTPLSTPGTREIQDLLDPQTRFLVYSLGDDASYLWLVGPDEIAAHTLPERVVLEKIALKTYKTLAFSDQPGGHDHRPAKALGALLLPLDLGPLKEARRLVVVPDGGLHAIPFAALPDPRTGRPLIHDRAIVTLPSLSVLEVLRHRSSVREPAPKRLAAMADPIYGPNDVRLTEPPSENTWRGLPTLARLHHSNREAEAILAFVAQSQRLGLFGFDAHRDAVLGGGLGSFRIVHLSVHGEIVEDRPELTSLVFSRVDRQGRLRDDRLFVHEIDDLSLPCELIVLSACNSALGKAVRGEGLVGLTQAVFRAGANRALVSLWYVDDEATAELMVRFYRALLLEGLAPPEALQRAQLELPTVNQHWRAPFFWAGFVLQGDWRWSFDHFARP